MANDLPSNAGDSGLIYSGGTKFSHTLEQLSLSARTKIPCSATKT